MAENLSNLVDRLVYQRNVCEDIWDEIEELEGRLVDAKLQYRYGLAHLEKIQKEIDEQGG